MRKGGLFLVEAPTKPKKGRGGDHRGNLSPERLSEIGQAGANARWAARRNDPDFIARRRRQIAKLSESLPESREGATA